MVKFLKPGKAVIVLQGQYAGRKGVIICSFDDGTCNRPYSHCLVVDISKYPKKVIRMEVDLKDVVLVTPDALNSSSRDKKVTAAKEAKARFEERFKTGKNRWFFSKRRF